MTLARYPDKAADGSWRFLYADLAGAANCGEPGGQKKPGEKGCGAGGWFLMKLGASTRAARNRFTAFP